MKKQYIEPTEEQKKKEKAINDIYDAINKYVLLCGGKIIVIGGVTIERSQYGNKYKFRVCVDCTGSLPEAQP